jgi:preprotein translocase subunit SecE
VAATSPRIAFYVNAQNTVDDNLLVPPPNDLQAPKNQNQDEVVQTFGIMALAISEEANLSKREISVKGKNKVLREKDEIYDMFLRRSRALELAESNEATTLWRIDSNKNQNEETCKEETEKTFDINELEKSVGTRGEETQMLTGSFKSSNGSKRNRYKRIGAFLEDCYNEEFPSRIKLINTTINVGLVLIFVALFLVLGLVLYVKM